MRKTLLESLSHGPLTEAPPAPDEAALAELAKRVEKAAQALLLGQRGEQVQDEGVNLRPQLGDEEGHLVNCRFGIPAIPICRCLSKTGGIGSEKTPQNRTTCGLTCFGMFLTSRHAAARLPSPRQLYFALMPP